MSTCLHLIYTLVTGMAERSLQVDGIGLAPVGADPDGIGCGLVACAPVCPNNGLGYGRLGTLKAGLAKYAVPILGKDG